MRSGCDADGPASVRTAASKSSASRCSLGVGSRSASTYGVPRGCRPLVRPCQSPDVVRGEWEERSVGRAILAAALPTRTMSRPIAWLSRTRNGRWSSTSETRPQRAVGVRTGRSRIRAFSDCPVHVREEDGVGVCHAGRDAPDEDVGAVIAVTIGAWPCVPGTPAGIGEERDHGDLNGRGNGTPNRGALRFGGRGALRSGRGVPVGLPFKVPPGKQRRNRQCRKGVTRQEEDVRVTDVIGRRQTAC
jgi:hypothetical protein